jgi:hypothetical protein
MKKIFLIVASIFITLLSHPVLAQLEEPGDDPDVPAAPIDDYIWVLAAIGLVYVFFKVRAFALRANLPKQ